MSIKSLHLEKEAKLERKFFREKMSDWYLVPVRHAGHGNNSEAGVLCFVHFVKYGKEQFFFGNEFHVV